MSDRKGGFGAFLFGVVLGAVAGFMFAPEGGEGTRRRVGRGLRNLKALAEEKVGEVRGLLKEVDEDEDEDEALEEDEDEEEPELTTREQLRRRLEAARRRRGVGRKEEEEPLA